MYGQEKTHNKESFNLKSFIPQNKIGSGSFGKVYLVKDKNTGQVYASKISIEDIESNTDSKLIDLSREINIISKLNHPSILKFVGFSPTDFKKRPRPVIITEYVSNGTLSDLILLERSQLISQDIFNDTTKLIIIYGIASGMSYLHSHDIIHRDLKPDNILINDYLLPKIADFGLSKVKNNDNSDLNSTLGIKGTPIYISPEIWRKYEYGKASDVYAFAMIVYELLTNDEPFEKCHIFQIQCKILAGYRPNFNKAIPQSYKNLIEKCWSEDPKDRPTFEQIVDKLKNDRNFITETIDEEKFLNYVNFINQKFHLILLNLGLKKFSQIENNSIKKCLKTSIIR